MRMLAVIRTHALLLACAATIAAGCSRSDTDTIRLGYLQSDLHHLPAFVALEKGFFDDEGLKVTIGGIFRAGPELMSAFAAEELDVGYVGLAPAATASLNGVADVSILALVNEEGSAVVCRPGDCTSVAHLQGKTIAIPGHATMQDCLIQKGIRTAGLTTSMLRLMVLKPPEMLQSLKAGSIDCFIAWEPYPSQAAVQGNGAIIERSHTLWPQHPCCVLIAHGNFSRTRPNAAEKIRRAHQRSCSFIADHPDEALDIAQRYTGMPRAVLEQAIAHMQFIPEIDREKIQEFEEFLYELGYVTAVRGIKRQLEFFSANE
jgi:NitT/TauT family transport system substrate-binding protein